MYTPLSCESEFFFFFFFSTKGRNPIFWVYAHGESIQCTPTVLNSTGQCSTDHWDRFAPDGRQVVIRARDMGGARGEWGAGPREALGPFARLQLVGE